MAKTRFLFLLILLSGVLFAQTAVKEAPKPPVAPELPPKPAATPAAPPAEKPTDPLEVEKAKSAYLKAQLDFQTAFMQADNQYKLNDKQLAVQQLFGSFSALMHCKNGLNPQALACNAEQPATPAPDAKQPPAAAKK